MVWDLILDLIMKHRYVYLNVEMVISFFPLAPSLHRLGDGKKKLDFSFSSPSYRALKSKVSKNDAKVPHFEADLRVGSHAGGKLFCLSV